MPLLGEGHSSRVGDEAPYFKSLADLDAWSSAPHDKLTGVVPYQPRPAVDGQSDSKGKLLVCHDYKGGYTETPSGLCYTFNFWRLCDIFVYFSHHRITVPPSGWTNTAHRQGTMMLGTLIVEGSNSPTSESLGLIVGHADCVIVDKKIPISKRYAVLLAELAYQRGFDGYLLNFESDLPYGANHARALASWILTLKAELKAKVGPHAQVMWYDSVVYNGKVAYQNRLNGYNLPFFLASDSLFTNYWWTPETQNSMTQYFRNLNKSLLEPNGLTSALATTKTLRDIYSGVDVWPGRHQYGGSGLNCYRAITHTAPRGFSTAFFAPAWTWESATKDPEQNWTEWWGNERKLWLGPLKPGEIIEVPPAPEGPFQPMTAFFPDLPQPDPCGFTFYTHFSPGVGYFWFVEGKKVLDTQKGWTDIDKQSSIGNLVWPWPTPSRECDISEPEKKSETSTPTASTTFDMTDGYNGGNSLKLTLACASNVLKSDSTDKTIWLPVQSLAVTSGESFEVCVVYKMTADEAVDLDPRCFIKPLSQEEYDDRTISVGPVTLSFLPNGWTQQTVNFVSTSTSNVVLVAIGFILWIKPKNPSAQVTFSLSLGQLAVYPTPPPPSVSVGAVSITRVHFTPTGLKAYEGVLTWDTASTLSPFNSDGQVLDKESTTPAWLLENTPAYRFPTILYSNIYVAPLDSGSTQTDVANLVFIGTTGLDGRANRFYVEPACLPVGWDKWAGTRFYVQGVTDRGEVLLWERCATVDYVRDPSQLKTVNLLRV